MEFETLDSTDIKEIMDDTWDTEKKRERLKKADELQKKSPPPAPPLPVTAAKETLSGPDTDACQTS